MTRRILAVVAIAAAALAGCTGGGGTGATPAPSASSNEAAALALATCMRANGFPNFPDPVKDDRGRWYFPPEAAGDWLPPEACRDLVRGWKSAFADDKAVTDADLAKLREYTTCMHQHGIEDFPDPDADGNFELPDRLRTLADNQDPTFGAAARACASLLPPGWAKKEGS